MSSGTDSATLRGTISDPGGYWIKGRDVALSIGGALWRFPDVSTKGTSQIVATKTDKTSGTLSFAYNAVTKKWTFSATVKRPSGQKWWDDEGLLNADLPAPGVPVFLDVNIEFDSDHFYYNKYKLNQLIGGYYTNKLGVGGAMTK